VKALIFFFEKVLSQGYLKDFTIFPMVEHIRNDNMLIKIRTGLWKNGKENFRNLTGTTLSKMVLPSNVMNISLPWVHLSISGRLRRFVVHRTRQWCSMASNFWSHFSGEAIEK